jgi:hypothetical protein
VHSEIGKRNTMEDDDIIVDSFCGDEKQIYVGLYDGHGGRATVDFVVKVLPRFWLDFGLAWASLCLFPLSLLSLLSLLTLPTRLTGATHELGATAQEPPG